MLAMITSCHNMPNSGLHRLPLGGAGCIFAGTTARPTAIFRNIPLSAQESAEMILGMGHDRVLSCVSYTLHFIIYESSCIKFVETES